MLTELPERFASKVSVATNGCWHWTGSTDAKGYGFYWLGSRRDGRMYRAHRVAYELLVGPIPTGLVIDHLCCNPDHLEVVTPGENTLRGGSPSAVNARMEKCGQGHPFDAVNSASGSRVCRACQNEWNRAYRRRKRQTLSSGGALCLSA